MAAAGAIAMLALAGCGGDDEDDGGGGDATTPAAAATTTAADPAPTETGATEHAGDATEPGATLAVGDTAHVPRKPLNAGIGDETTFPLEVTVLEIQKASISDFKGMSLDANEQKSTPYYVTVRLASPGKTALPADDDPDLGIKGIDDRGQEQGSITFIGDFAKCEDTKPPKAFKDGKSYETCLAFLVGGTGSITEARWTGAPDYVIKPVVWK